MTLEQALLKIINLQDEVAKLKEQLHEANSKVSLTGILTTHKQDSSWTFKRISEDSCQHEYPNPWFGITAPSCKKCGQIAQIPTITCVSAWISGLDNSGATTHYPLVLKTNGQ